jgi:hypothetical protein
MLSYGTVSSHVFVPDIAIDSLTPTLSETSVPVTSYSISPDLPVGLKIDSITGVISGTPTQHTVKTNYTITGIRLDAKGIQGQLEITVAAPVQHASSGAILHVAGGGVSVGADDLTVTKPNTIVNAYATITDATVAAGSASFNVYNADQASQFARGDQILVIQMQAPTSSDFHQELVEVSSVSGTQIQLATAFTTMSMYSLELLLKQCLGMVSGGYCLF